MPVRVSCECGKVLQAKDEWRGKRVRCPACGEVLVIPAKEKEPIKADYALQAGARPDKTTNLKEKLEDSEEPKKAKSKKRKKKKGFRLKVPAIDILGIQMTLRNWILFICIAAVVGGIIYILVPSYHAKVVEARGVDVYAALDVKSRNVMKEMLGATARGILTPGGERFLIIRENPNGESVRIQLKLPPKFLSNRADIHQGTLMIYNNDFQLRGDGEPVNPLFLDLETNFDQAQGATMDFSAAKSPDAFIPRDRTPWTHQGETLRDYKLEEKRIKTDLGEDIILVCTGSARFNGQRGMEVRYEYMGSSVVVSWDSESKALVASRSLEYLDRFMLESLELVCIFPRPAGKQLSLTILGDPVGVIKPR